MRHVHYGQKQRLGQKEIQLYFGSRTNLPIIYMKTPFSTQLEQHLSIYKSHIITNYADCINDVSHMNVYVQHKANI